MSKLVNHNLLVDGNRIAYGIHGTGEPVVLIHGTPFFSHIWRRLLPALADHGYQVYLYDLLGFGHSERPKDPAVDTSVSAQLPILLALLDHWGLDRCRVVSHDIGGAIAMQLGVYHPERVKSLTVIDCVSYDSWPSPRTREQMEAGLDKLISASDESHRGHFREWILSAAYHKERLREDALETYLEMISGPIGQASLFQHQIRHYDPAHTMKIADRLRELEALRPQFIWGANDEWQVVDWAHRLHQAIPGSTLDLIENSGHLVMEDQPDQLERLVLDYLHPR